MSVIVPVFRGADHLRVSLPDLLANTLSRTEWELIVVDDGSGDDTAAVAAAFADRVLRVPNGPRGPGHARNLGAVEARGDVLLFVDADVRVHRHVLERVLARFDDDRTLTAVFGSYDDHPSAEGLVSQYRNLLHRYVHIEHAGTATTFWAGCGAVRRAPFMAVGGFDTHRYPRPQIEDIELGYRLHDAGGTMLLDPGIGGTHLKRWTLWGMLRTDVRDRAVPWMRLLLERHTALANGPLNTSRREQAFVTATALATVAGLAWLMSGAGHFLLAAVGGVGIVVAGNAPLFGWFARMRGPVFAAGTVPLRMLYYVAGVIGAAWAVVTYCAGMLRPDQQTTRPRTTLPALVGSSPYDAGPR